MARCPNCGGDHPPDMDLGNGNVVDHPCYPQPPKRKPQKCNICGRFVNRDGKCPKVSYDSYSGGWEHF